MINTMIFDLDGTLVQTEKLKALSYARAAVELCPHSLDEADVVEAFKDVVGLSRREVALALVERFGLAEKASQHLGEFGVITAWQAYVQLRLQIYGQILADPQILVKNQWPHNMALLHDARRHCRYVALATMSYCSQVQRVLEILELRDAFDFVASRDDVEHGKPHPEIYLMVAHELGVNPDECLVIEDSPTGVKAALNAGMQVVAVSTPFTQKRLHESNLLPVGHIVDDANELPAIVAHVVEHINSAG